MMQQEPYKSAVAPLPLVHPVTSPTVDLIHSSSRFDRSAHSLISDVSDWLEEVSLITLTEVSDGSRAQALHASGWHVVHPTRIVDVDTDKPHNRRVDCAVLADPTVWRVLHGAITRELSSIAWFNGNRKHDLVRCTTAVLAHRETAQLLLVSVVHFPADVEGRPTWSRTIRKVRAHRQAMRAWVRHIERQKFVHSADGVILACDLNLNARRWWVRAYLRRHWSRLGIRLTWRPPLPLKGTHGRRIIDVVLTDLHLSRPPYILKQVASSDHKPVKVGLRFRRPVR